MWARDLASLYDLKLTPSRDAARANPGRGGLVERIVSFDTLPLILYLTCHELD